MLHSTPQSFDTTNTPQSGSIAVSSDLRALARELGMEYVDLADVVADVGLLNLFPTGTLFREGVFPLARTAHGQVRVALSDPYNLEVLDELTALSGFSLEAVLADRRDIEARLNAALGVGGGTVSALVTRGNVQVSIANEHDVELENSESEASVVKLVNELLVEALAQGASDVHLEPRGDGLDVRFRIDGMLRTQPMPVELHRFRAAIISRLKIMSRLNIAEKRLPQDGRIKLTIQNREIDVRVSVIPMLYGEGIVMRLLDRSRTAIDLPTMRFPPAILEEWKKVIRRPHGMILVTGPTGSGKTTTLYASLAEIRDAATKIITVEDPVEYHLDGISQIQVHSKIGLTFAAGLRSILRHDPDVVLIGEIRDSETAVSAIQAALTGHLVFSTLHTNDAASAFTRLTDMGIEPYLVASTVHAVLAQRLVRKLCRECRRPVKLSSIELPNDLQAPSNTVVFEAVGCRSCHGTGYAGRLAIFELLRTDATTRKLCVQRADAPEIRQHALQCGMTSLRESGWRLVLTGETTLDEVLRAAADEDDSIQIPVPAKAISSSVEQGRS